MNPTETIMIKKSGLYWLECAPITWEDRVSALSMSERQELERWLDSVCERAAMLSGYLDARGVTGCGDNGHADGVKHANRKLVAVRRALGFIDPKAGQVRF